MSTKGVNWTCPFCNRPQTLTEHQLGSVTGCFWVPGNKHGPIGLRGEAIVCANPGCNDVTLTVKLTNGAVAQNGQYHPKSVVETFSRPSSSSKIQPEYIPEPLREDYYEACRIRDLSPKASATLSRRCIQGMIRDFCGISKATLYEEIETLKNQSDTGNEPKGVDAEAVEALHHVRSIGNIGAHMQRDIDIIVPVDPGEAQALIELIELLFDEWYVARQKRAQQLSRIKEIKLQKDGVIQAAKLAKANPKSDQ